MPIELQIAQLQATLAAALTAVRKMPPGSPQAIELLMLIKEGLDAIDEERARVGEDVPPISPSSWHKIHTF